MRNYLFIALVSIVLIGSLLVLFSTINQPDLGPSPPKTPEYQLKTFQLETGLDIQLVASEPLVQDPVFIQFDEFGRLWVVEMRGFMPDIDGLGESEPVGRINILEDTDGDGTMDISTIYLDSLIMPRALAVVSEGALVVENMSLWWTQDLDGDGKADTKVLVDPDYAGNHLPEHSANGLLRGMDNWYYNAKSRFRYKRVDEGWIRDSTEFRGQWGISQDDFGRLVYNYNWSQLHADLAPPNYLNRNPHHTPTTGIDHGLTVDRRIYPIRQNLAINRGYIPGILDEEGKLQEFTAACAPFYFRSNALSEAFYGNVFVCEPSGNLVKRNVVREDGIVLFAEDPNPGKEFLASTDERFRPVNLASGPDGALYIADMYRGLVQHGAYISPYLREQTLSRNLVLPVNRGRIWRIVPEGFKSQPFPKLASYTVEELVQTLFHPNGWHRDMAQRLLVDRNDPKTIPVLWKTIEEKSNRWGKIHALWSLEALDGLEGSSLVPLLSDSDPYVAATALRLLEPFAKENSSIGINILSNINPSSLNKLTPFVLQLALSSSVLFPDSASEILSKIITLHSDSPLIRDAVLSGLEHTQYDFLQTLLKHPDWAVSDPEKEIVIEMLTGAILKKGNANEVGQLVAFLERNSPSQSWKYSPILTALTIVGNNSSGKAFHLEKAPLFLSENRKDNLSSHQYIALSRLFTWPGMETRQEVLAQSIPLTGDEQKLFALGRQHYLSICSGCHGNAGEGVNRLGPPLAGSEWVTGDQKQLSLIVLHGMEGPVEVSGKTYDAPDILPVMPAHTSLDDGTLSAILTYIRNEWGNNAGAVDRRFIATTRNVTQGRVLPWSAEELKTYIKAENDKSP